MFKFLVVLAACVAVRAVEYGHDGGYGGHGGHDDYYTEPHYSFSYEVKDSHTGDYKSHHEERKGDHTQGVYSLVEPDGSKRTVEYLVEGKSGLIAKVHRDGSSYSNGYGDHQSYEKPSYNSGYKPSYDSGYKPSYKPSYSQSYHQPSYNKPSYHQASYQQHSYNQPSYHQPSYNKPSYHQASYHHEEPSYHQPSYNKPSYHQPSYHHEEPSYSKPSYGHGHASSSVSISTHGAKISTSTNHHAPAKYGY